MSVNLKHPKYYFNRELSWLKFNDRVLEEAADPFHPLLERLKFLAIYSSNLDEFYMIRVGGLMEQIAAGIQDAPADGLIPEVQADLVAEHVHKAVDYQYALLDEDILPKLKKKGIRIRKLNTLRKREQTYIEEYFEKQIYPILTPLAIDPTHPFPKLKSLGLSLLLELRAPYKNERKKAVIHIPSTLPRFIEIPQEGKNKDFIAIEDIIQKFAGLLFPQMKILSIFPFRITRNADIDLAEAEADDLLKHIERELRKRRIGTVIRMEVSKEMSIENRNFLQEMTGIEERGIFDIPSYLDLTSFFQFLGLNFPEIKDIPFTPVPNSSLVSKKSIFETISEGDILLHHPYESFNHVSELLKEASEDPQVLAIKITLYRTTGQSPIVAALKQAVENGKQVTALIELKARFDEENNIVWAKELDNAGVNVVYGILGLKTHCKITMIVRKEHNQIKRYLHLSTGNYNEKTARIYTDIGLMTTNPEMGEDASALFNLLTGYSLQKDWKKFLIAPNALRKSLKKLAELCIQNHSKNNPSSIKIVVNSLVDPEFIRLLYKASMAGIHVELIVRGICCLRPGVPGISQNIRVKSIVGRFLEHSRIFWFNFNGQSHIYMGSADLMQRNLDRRVELVFPIEDIRIKRRVKTIIQSMWDDERNSRWLKQDGTYEKVIVKNGFDVQQFLISEALSRQEGIDTIQPV
ncbi:MAG: polyphosphate kinase 1 [Bacteroidia bacterium]|nr:polyphosphate kinase 1 [Bacteroidia bacterium]